jgi:hypothetical protein
MCPRTKVLGQYVPWTVRPCQMCPDPAPHTVQVLDKSQQFFSQKLELDWVPGDQLGCNPSFVHLTRQMDRILCIYSASGLYVPDLTRPKITPAPHPPERDGS